MNKYLEKQRSIVNYVKTVMKTKHPRAYVSYNDYHTDSYGGMWFILQWDEGPDEYEVSNWIDGHFLGIRCHGAWGDWTHQMMVTVEARACN